MRKSNSGWNPEDESYFSAFPSGYRHQASGFWWNSSLYQNPNDPEIQAYYLNIKNGVSYHTNFDEEGEGVQSAGMNVRCIKD
ncbi:MAG: hypothetical protein ACERKD_09965 [Prolixibacteraceae bacterium]